MLLKILHTGRAIIYPTGCAAHGRSQERLSSNDNSALVLQAVPSPSVTFTAVRAVWARGGGSF